MWCGQVEAAECRAAAAAGRLSTLHAQLESQTAETAALRQELASVSTRCPPGLRRIYEYSMYKFLYMCFMSITTGKKRRFGFKYCVAMGT